MLDLKRKIEEMKRDDIERSDRQNILKLRREKDEFAEEIISLKKEIDFLNCQLKVSNTLYICLNILMWHLIKFCLEDQRIGRE